MSTHPFAGMTFSTLIALPLSDLDQVMSHGATPTADQLAGSEFRGFNPPLFAKVLGFQKFMKGFWVDEEGKLAGYNLFVKSARGGPDAPWEPKKAGTAGRHGFYDVEPIASEGRYTDYPNAVLLNYGSGRNSMANPEARIRDFLVQVDPDNPDLFLGKAYLDLALARAFSNFFILERLRDAPKD
ncbi:MAG: hypothetical protein KC912_12215 [Proteobacteria bacterium]|nr:hypothetical protein [Pseudomonadota bacterium]